MVQNLFWNFTSATSEANCTWCIQELSSEQGTGEDLYSPAPLLNKEILDRVVMSRLLEPPANYPQWPVHYLLGCYDRASQQLRQAGQLKDKNFSARLQQALAEIKDLAVRYTGLLLTMDGSMFEQVCCISMPCMHRSDLEYPSTGHGAVLSCMSLATPAMPTSLHCLSKLS